MVLPLWFTVNEPLVVPLDCIVIVPLPTEGISEALATFTSELTVLLKSESTSEIPVIYNDYHCLFLVMLYLISQVTISDCLKT